MLESDGRKPAGDLVRNLDGGNERRFLVFSLCDEQYAVPLSVVREVLALTEITPVPHTPDHFKGIMNLRGQVLSVIDLRLKLAMPRADITPETAIIILDFSPLSLGVIVDLVDCVHAASTAEIQDPPSIESKIRSDYITGIIRREQRLVISLDINKALDIEDLRTIKNNDATRQAI